MRPRNNRQGPGRRGAALMVAIVCLILLVALIASMARLGVARRQQTLGEERRIQAAWLAESGLERAWSRLASDPSYRGEEWLVPSAELGSKDDGFVRIAVEGVEARADRRRIRVVADFPRDESRRSRQSRSVVIEAGEIAPGDRR